MVRVHCTGCGREIELPPGTRSGDVIACPNGAGLSLRVSEQAGRWFVVPLKTASCAIADELIILPDDVQPGDIIDCHGIKQRVTYEYGAYALEKMGRCDIGKYRMQSLGFWGGWRLPSRRSAASCRSRGLCWGWGAARSGGPPCGTGRSSSRRGSSGLCLAGPCSFGSANGALPWLAGWPAAL